MIGNTVDSLKSLYKTMTGNDWPYEPNPTDAEVIDKIAKDATPGGGGGGVDLVFPFEVEMTMDDNEPVYTCLTPFDDIVDAVNAGKTLKMVMSLHSMPDAPVEESILSGANIRIGYEEPGEPAVGIQLVIVSCLPSSTGLHVMWLNIAPDGATDFGQFTLSGSSDAPPNIGDLRYQA